MMNSVRAGCWYALGLHALAFGLLGFWGIYRPAILLGGNDKHIFTLTSIAAPADLIEAHDSSKPMMPAAPPPQPAKPPEPAKSKPVGQPSKTSPALEQLEPDALQPPEALIPEDEVKPVIAPPAPAMAVAQQRALSLASWSAPPLATRTIDAQPHGDGSSPKPGEDLTTRLAPAPIQARPGYRKNPQPPYPAIAARRHQEGLVLLRVVVSPEGHAKRVELKQTSGFQLLDKAAKDAVELWEFEPARIGPTPMESEIEVPVRFTLQGW